MMFWCRVGAGSGPGPGPAEGLALRGTVKPRMSGTADYDVVSGRAVFREITNYETREISLGNGRYATFRAVTGRKHERSPRQSRGQGRSRGAAMRDVLAAVAHDLMGCDAFEVGTRILGGAPRRTRGRRAGQPRMAPERPGLEARSVDSQPARLLALGSRARWETLTSGVAGGRRLHRAAAGLSEPSLKTQTDQRRRGADAGERMPRKMGRCRASGTFSRLPPR